jgi:predicted aspartyl protease
MLRRFSTTIASLNRHRISGFQSMRRDNVAALFIFALATLAPASLSAAENKNAAEPAPLVRIPFELRRGHVMVPATVHGTNKLSLLLDTGYGMTMLHPQVVATADLPRAGRGVTIVGIAGEERASSFEGPAFEFGNVTWKPRRVAALSDEGGSRSRRRDGVLGSGFFRRFVVRIEPKLKVIELLEPDTFTYSGSGEILPLDFKSTTPSIEVSVQLTDTKETKAVFEIDTGCDGALCIGDHFTKEHNLGGGSRNEGARVGVGGTRRTKESRFVRLNLGRFAIEKPEANLFLEGSPVDPPLAGHIGWELLKDFRVIFDYSRRRMILERVTVRVE